MDNDTLLTRDRSFPYADKDLELICGSLVTIRKGVLQVIHLTVKEFLRSPQDKGGSTSPSLLVDSECGSLQLTLVCLRCIAVYAEPLIDLKSEAPHIDWTLEPRALESCRARAPLLEYASFSWLVHIIDCKLDDLNNITPIFQKTFSSPTTFSWVEMCMVSQPDSALRLSVGISELLDWLGARNQGLQLQQEATSQFLTSWCMAMSCVFEEYGAVLARRPWQIYIIDICYIFTADPILRKLWQECGETPLREKDLHLKGYQVSRPRQEVAKPHLQLQRPLQIWRYGRTPVFLIHNEAQHLYIWGEVLVEGNSLSIYVQQDKTGQRLPPAEYLGPESGQRWELIDRELSPNGGYLVLYYFSLDSVKSSRLTLAWRINENMSFRRRMDCEPWARVVFSHTSDCGPMNRCSRAIMFQNNHCCITPIGTLDLLTGSRQPLPENATHSIEMTFGLFYCCGGQYLFASAIYEPSNNTPVQARRVSISASTHPVDFFWEDKMRGFVNVSSSGRYLVLERPIDSFGKTIEEEALYVYDTKLNETLELPFPKPLDYFEGKFEFSQDETRLIAFMVGRKNLTVIIWDCLGPGPKLSSHASLDMDQNINSLGIYVHKAATSAVIATGTRIIQRIELGDRIKFLDARDTIDDYPCKISTVSRDGSHWASVSYGRNGGKVQIIDLQWPGAPARHFVLQWSHSDTPEAIEEGLSLPIGISPDLSVLIVNAEVFDLTTTATSNGKDTSKSITLTSFTVEAAPALLRPHRYQYETWGLQCRISPCNSYVIYVGSGDQWGERSRYPSVIFLFRLDVQKRTSAQFELMLPERIISLNADFHPSLPLLALSYASSTATEFKIIRESPPVLRPVMYNLESLEMTILEVSKTQLLDAIAK